MSLIVALFRWLMAFRPPTFVLPVLAWRQVPVAGAATNNFLGNLSPGRRSMQAQGVIVTNAQLGATASGGDLMELLCPAGTDIAGPQGAGPSDVVEVPAFSGRFYYVVWADDVGKGFPNEYRIALLRQCDYLFCGVLGVIALWGVIPPWPIPTP